MFANLRTAALRSPKLSHSLIRPFSGTPTEATFDLTGCFQTHNLPSAPENSVTATTEDLQRMHSLMYTMRRMEITCDNEYKARNIRGFCHLYDGQEAIATGVEESLTHEDSWITSYRCHCVALCRGGSVEQVLGELFGLQGGYTKGKGGSMHFYNKAHNFFGGQGIVGAQVPVGTGLAFANKYNTPEGEAMPVAMACYGDGAANQGQIWEAANMAALWKLPMIFCIENNSYGMGTSVERHSAIPNGEYFRMGGETVPGLKIDGMNALAVKEGMRFAKEWTSTGNGPLYIEMNTYRYHGHSMSDPGTTYRSRDEIAATRSARDPIEFIKKCMTENNLVEMDDLKKKEKGLRKEVADATTRAKAFTAPPPEELYNYVYAKDHLVRESVEQVPFIRMPEIQDSIVNGVAPK